MRGLRWLIGALMVIGVLGLAFFFRKPSQEIEDLRPYIISETVVFLGADKNRFAVGKPLPAALENHVYYLRDIPEGKLVAILNRVVKQRSASDGWYATTTPPSFDRDWIYNATARKGYGCLNANRGYVEGTGLFMPKEHVVFTVQDTLPMSKVDLVRFRMLHRGEPHF